MILNRLSRIFRPTQCLVPLGKTKTATKKATRRRPLHHTENASSAAQELMKAAPQEIILSERVVRGATWGSTNQKAGFRSRGTNGPISVQQEVM